MKTKEQLIGILKEVVDVFKKHDVVGLAIVHIPGLTMSELQPQASFTCATKTNQELEIKSGPDDFGGNEELRFASLSNTLNAFASMSRAAAHQSFTLGNVANEIEAKAGIKRGELLRIDPINSPTNKTNMN